MKQILQSCLFSTLAAAIGLSVVLVVGRLYWPLGSGLSGIAIGLFTAGFIALLMRFHFHTASSVLAACLAGAMASFMAIANAELLPPGSFEWMFKGGLYGACFGLPLAFLLGPIGMLENFLVPISSHHAKSEPKP